MEENYWYDEEEARRVVEFSRRFLTHQKGELANTPLHLDDWQIEDIVAPLFGMKRPDGTRQFRQATCFLPRKQGKSTLAVLVALYCLFCDNEPGAEVYCCAVFAAVFAGFLLPGLPANTFRCAAFGGFAI